MRSTALFLLLLLLPGSALAGPEGTLEKLSLQEAVQRALSRNASIAVAAAQVRRAAALVEQVRAASLPTLTGYGTYTRLDANREIQGQIFVAADQFSANLTLSVPLLQPVSWARWTQAHADRHVAQLSRADVQRQVAIAVAHTYLTLITQRRVIEQNERARDTAQAHYDYTRKRLTEGLGSQLDEVRAGQELNTDEAAVEREQSALLRAQAALGVLLGEDRLVDAAGEPDLPAPPDLDTALGQARRARADIAALVARQDAARLRVCQRFADYLPQVTGLFQPMYQYPSTIVQPQLSWQLQLLLTVPLYDGGLRYGLAHERAALFDEARANLGGALRQAEADLRAGHAQLSHAERAAARALQAAAQARKAVDIATLSYKNGATTNLELIDAQRRARDADTMAALLEDDLRKLRLDLLAASGNFP